VTDELWNVAFLAEGVVPPRKFVATTTRVGPRAAMGRRRKSMKTMNLGEADGLPTLEWRLVELQLADLLTDDDPRSPNRTTFWRTTLNADGSPHVTSVGALKRLR